MFCSAIWSVTSGLLSPKITAALLHERFNLFIYLFFALQTVIVHVSLHLRCDSCHYVVPVAFSVMMPFYDAKKRHHKNVLLLFLVLHECYCL